MQNLTQVAQNLTHNRLLKVHHEKHVEGEPSLFTMSDNKILDLIYETHVHEDDTFDVDSLFLITENIIKRSAQIVDNIVQGNRVHVESIDEKPPKASFSSPLCTLKSIGCELSSCSCQTPSEETAHKSTLSILNKLSTYSWEAKAVLALAAFAMEYGEFWLLAHTQQSDLLAKSVAILKRVPVLLKPAELQKRRQAVLELNLLIKTTLQVIECIFELEKFSVYDPKDVPALTIAMDSVPVNVYWSIITVVACATKINLLTSDEEKPHDLSQFSQKITFILNRLKIQLIHCKRQKEEAEARRKVAKLLQTATEVMEIIKALTTSKDNVQKIIDGSTNTTVSIDVLKRKYVLLFLSTLDISDEDISILKPVYEGSKKEDKYKIVWIPLVEYWTDELRKKFDVLRAKMPWYAVQCSPVVGIKFIREKFDFKGKPAVVLMNPQGKVQNPNALHLIRVYGMKAFPFYVGIDATIQKDPASIMDFAHQMDPSISGWVREEKYIFFYGGKDNDWIQQFSKKATAIVNDPLIKDLKINIELFCVGKSPKGGEDHGLLGRFWNGIESLFFIHSHKETDAVPKEVQKLLAYKNESGWAVLSKGSTAIVTGHGLTILKVLEDFDSWKTFIKTKGFEVAFKMYHDKLIQSGDVHCCRLDIPTVAGKVPETMKCPECPRTMETFVSYKCCHVDAPFNAHH